MIPVRFSEVLEIGSAARPRIERSFGMVVGAASAKSVANGSSRASQVRSHHEASGETSPWGDRRTTTVPRRDVGPLRCSPPVWIDACAALPA